MVSDGTPRPKRRRGGGGAAKESSTVAPCWPGQASRGSAQPPLLAGASARARLWGHTRPATQAARICAPCLSHVASGGSGVGLSVSLTAMRCNRPNRLVSTSTLCAFQQHVLLPHAWGYTSYPSLLIIGEPAGSRLMYFAPLPISGETGVRRVGFRGSDYVCPSK